jgi:hypothetical protein
MKRSDGTSGAKMPAVLEIQALFGDGRECGEQLSRQHWPGGYRAPGFAALEVVPGAAAAML